MAPSPSVLSLPWDSIHCSCLLDHHHLFRETEIWDHPAVMLLLFIQQHLQLQLSPKNIHTIRSRFAPASHKCCGSEQVSVSHFLLEDFLTVSGCYEQDYASFWINPTFLSMAAPLPAEQWEYLGIFALITVQPFDFTWRLRIAREV